MDTKELHPLTTCEYCIWIRVPITSSIQIIINSIYTIIPDPQAWYWMKAVCGFNLPDYELTPNILFPLAKTYQKINTVPLASIVVQQLRFIGIKLFRILIPGTILSSSLWRICSRWWGWCSATSRWGSTCGGATPTPTCLASPRIPRLSRADKIKRGYEGGI